MGTKNRMQHKDEMLLWRKEVIRETNKNSISSEHDFATECERSLRSNSDRIVTEHSQPEEAWFHKYGANVPSQTRKFNILRTH